MRVLRDDGLCFIFGQLGKREHAFLHLMSRLTLQHRFHDLIIWDRAVGYDERRDSFTPQYEMVLVMRKGDKVKFNKEAVRVPYDAKTIETYLKDKRYKDMDARRAHLDAGKFATNILRVPSLKGVSNEKCGHPSQKPIDLIEKLVACSTDANDLVIDPFLGSGTTAAATASGPPLARHRKRFQLHPDRSKTPQTPRLIFLHPFQSNIVNHPSHERPHPRHHRYQASSPS
jgi:site-specific DNA-methyltransferase (adenine-specific)